MLTLDETDIVTDEAELKKVFSVIDEMFKDKKIGSKGSLGSYRRHAYAIMEEYGKRNVMITRDFRYLKGYVDQYRKIVKLNKKLGDDFRGNLLFLFDELDVKLEPYVKKDRSIRTTKSNLKIWAEQVKDGMYILETTCEFPLNSAKKLKRSGVSVGNLEEKLLEAFERVRII